MKFSKTELMDQAVRGSDDARELLLQAGVNALQKSAGYTPKVTEDSPPMTYDEFWKANKVPGSKVNQWAIGKWLETVSKPSFSGGIAAFTTIFDAARRGAYWRLLPNMLKAGSTKYAWFREHQQLRDDPALLSQVEGMETDLRLQGRQSDETV